MRKFQRHLFFHKEDIGDNFSAKTILEYTIVMTYMILRDQHENTKICVLIIFALSPILDHRKKPASKRDMGR